MVIRGKPRGNGKQLGNYLLATGENDHIHVFDIRGTSQPSDMRKSLIEMALTSELTRSDKGLYHAQICPAYGEDKAMSREDWLKAASILEDELKLAGQKRVIVLHEKQGRIHAHVVWERYDHERGRMISDSYSRLAQDRARKTMEHDLSHQQTPHRNKHRPDMKRELIELWQQTATGAEFIKAARAKGYRLAKGEQRRPFMVVNGEGISFDLVRQLDKVRTAEVRERLAGEKLPTDKQAIRDVREERSRKSLLKAQEDMADRIEQHQQTSAAKQEKKEKFSAVMAGMKEEGQNLSADATDKNLNTAQDKASTMMKTYKASQDSLQQKQETEKERIKREYMEQMRQALQPGRSHGRSLSL